jgi:hypothetical protein
MKGSTWPMIQNGNISSHFNLSADFISEHKSTGEVCFYNTTYDEKGEAVYVLHEHTRE